jgi:hypothetical protein
MWETLAFYILFTFIGFSLGGFWYFLGYDNGWKAAIEQGKEWCKEAAREIGCID